MEAIWLSFQEVNRLLIGLNCGKALEPLTVVETAKDLSSQHDLIFRACRWRMGTVSSRFARKYNMLRKAPSVKLVSLRVNGAEIVFNPSATVGELSESMWPIEVIRG
ncbi:putative beta-ureidopropionase [Helianthus debilis subsp. tardiflorus]